MERDFSIRVSVMVALAVTTAAGLTGCSGSLTSSDEHWSTSSEMRHSSDGDSLPSFVAADARDIDFHARLTVRGTQISWRSKDGVHRADCETGPSTGSSRAGARWWPSTTPSRGWTCGWWSGFEQQGRFYAWDNRETAKA